MTAPEQRAVAGMEERLLFTLARRNEAEAERTATSDYSYWRSTWRAFLGNRTAVVLLVLMMSLVLLTIVQPYLPGQKDPVRIHRDPVTGLQLRNQPPGPDFWLGTNSIGQDLWARLWAGTRTSLIIALIVGAWEIAFGILVGAAWGYVRPLEAVITEAYNVIDNIPTTILLTLLAYIMRPSFQTMVIAMCATGWLAMARFVRNQIVILRDREYNLASRCLGTPTSRIVVRNLLPYLVSVIVLRMALSIPSTIGWEVFLTYIGLGLPLDQPTLGNLLNEGRQVMMAPSLRYQLIFPAAVLSVITVSFYVLGNAFADASDPRNHF